MKNKSTFVVLIAVGVSAVCVFAEKPAWAQSYRLERVPVIEEIPCKGHRKVIETKYVEEQVTTYETVWETETRERRYSVARQVPETSYSERRRIVRRPVEETEYRDTSYEVTRLVPETGEREERYIVPRQVTETQERQVYEMRRIPVQETSVEQRVYTVNRPVTNYVGTVVDRGQHVNQVTSVPGKTYERLAWQRANYIDPVTGESKWRIPGFYWTPMQGPDRYAVNRVYQPNYVTETVPVTSMVQEQRVEEVPVTRTTYRDEQVVRTEPVQVSRTVQEEVVRKIPVTTYKPIVERVEKTTPVIVRRMEEEEQVEQIPITTYKTIYEDKIEPYEVKVAKLVPVTRTVRRPITSEKWEPYTYTMERKKWEVRRIPVEPAIPLETAVIPQGTPVSKPSVDPADKAPVLP
jgi:hypothetical protein